MDFCQAKDKSGDPVLMKLKYNFYVSRSINIHDVLITRTVPLQDGEELEYDSRAYKMLHRMNLEWPCLSFDIIRDSLGYQRTKVRFFSLSNGMISCQIILIWYRFFIM